MENKQVMVVNTIKSRVGINVPDLFLKRVWERKGAKKPIDFDTLQQALYDPSVAYLFSEGILYIDDMKTKIALGLEEEGATTPSIVVLSDADLHRYLTAMPIFEFKNKVMKPLFFNELNQNVSPFYLYVNVTTAEILRKVLAEPKKYAPSGVYIMRIHGTFVNFLDLSPAIQQDIITRLDPQSTAIC